MKAGNTIRAHAGPRPGQRIRVPDPNDRGTVRPHLPGGRDGRSPPTADAPRICERPREASRLPGPEDERDKGGNRGTRPGIYEGPREPNPRIRGSSRNATRIRGLRKERGKRETGGGDPPGEGGRNPGPPQGPGREPDRNPGTGPPDIRKGSREPPQGLDRDPIQQCKRRRATLPHPLKCSTIAVQGLSFRVRNGTGRLTLAMVAANLQPITAPAGGRRHVAVREPDNGREFVPWTKRMLPAEGTSRRTQYGQHQEQAWCVV